MVRGLILCLVLMVICGARSFAADLPALPPAAARDVDFVRDIQPIFKTRCYACHDGVKQRGGLRLDRKSAAMNGGESFAPAIVPGQSADSPLVRFVAGLEDGMLMPPEGERISVEQIGLLRAWIDQGAKWPDSAAGEVDVASHWSFRPLVPPALPDVSRNDKAWMRNPIDAFVAAKLEAAGREPSPQFPSGGRKSPGSVPSTAANTTIEPRAEPGDLRPPLGISVEADRVTLIRRLSFDLLGLPPTPEDVAEFVTDDHPDAYERLVDRLLASPHFGERWARHWLDVVRFAESDGFETNQPRPNAWPYRDYVIRAFNEDIPYEQFVAEQLAGDALGVDEATGFIVGGAWDRVKSPDPGLTAQQRADELHDMVNTTGSAFLGLTVGCARCHNHKFDPISQTDYYALKAIFAGVQHGDRPLKPADAEQRETQLNEMRRELARIERELVQFEPLADPTATVPRRLAVHRQANIERVAPVKARFVKFTIEATTGGQPCIDELEVFSTGAEPKNVALASFGTKATSSSNLPGYEIHQLKHLNDGRYGNSASWISNEPGRGWVQLEFVEPVEIDRIVWSRDRPDDGKFSDRIPTKYRIEAGLTPDTLHVVTSSDDRMPFNQPSVKPTARTDLNEQQQVEFQQLTERQRSLQQQLQQVTTMPQVYAGRFVAPEPTRRFHRGDAMQPREPVAPAGLTSFGPQFKLPEDAPEATRRQQLAAWITDPRQPLTARVLTNRFWHFHFGQGLVTTPSDFGRNGAMPSHPELLDWLASDFRFSIADLRLKNEQDSLSVPSSNRKSKIENRKSPKRLHRLIVTSATYRQSSAARPDAMQADAGSRLLWRYPPRRLEAEPLRDAILSVCGNLDDRMGGPGFDLFEPNTNYVKVYNTKHEFGPAEWRRMVYQSKPRMQLDDTFGPFDCPDAGQIAPKRTSSITALQALNLLNSHFIVQQSDLFARRLEREAGPSPTAQVQRAFALTFLRAPARDEQSASVQLIEQHGLPAFCRALLNANEFLFVF